MRFELAWVSLLGLALTVVLSTLFAELVGYLLHRFLHSDRFPALSRAHLIHHLRLYGPTQPMRAPVYKNATDDRPSLGNIGLEWILPIAAILALACEIMSVFWIASPYRFIALGIMVVWPVVMFSYLHDRMHLQHFWMERSPLLKKWFLRSRRLHDIHHHSHNDHGRMDRNFGIGFFLFDRLFRTLAKRHRPLNRHGYRAALRRYNLERRSEEEFPSFPSGFRV